MTHQPGVIGREIGRLLEEAKTGTEPDDRKNRTTSAAERNKDKTCDAEQEKKALPARRPGPMEQKVEQIRNERSGEQIEEQGEARSPRTKEHPTQDKCDTQEAKTL